MKIENIYKFERVRLGDKTISQSGEKYGPYLYMNIQTGELIASWEKPVHGKDYLYSGGDIGLYSDALVYYKNY